MKNYVLIPFLLFAFFSGLANQDSLRVELLRVYPEPFRDCLKFEFAVHDTGQHEVKIAIQNGEGELIFMEKVAVYHGHETININTIDFAPPGSYSIKIKIDGKHRYLRKVKLAN